MRHLESLGIEVEKGTHHKQVIYGVVLLYNLIINEIGSYLSRFHLSPSKFNILIVIKHQGKTEGISQVEISKKLIVSAPNMTRLLDKLEKEKLIEKFSQEGDRRVKLIKITEKGSKLLNDVWPGYTAKLKILLNKIPQEDQKALAHLLSGWFDILVPG